LPVIRYGEALNVLVAAKGHPYLRDPFMAVFDGLAGMACTLVEQPAAARLMNPKGMAGFDVLVLYDMPGIDFAAQDGPRFVAPDPEFQEGIISLLEAGKGVVALHHAVAGWPTWDLYGDLLGGRFLYKPQRLRGVDRPDSGYRHEVTHEVYASAPGHPVLEGIPESFTLIDELYLFEVFEAEVTPLLRSRHAFVRDGFYSAAAAVAGRMHSNEGWTHAPGSDYVAWVKTARRSPLVYLQFGDGPQTYGDANFQRLVSNAIRWVASPEAHAWAQSQGRTS
jgi:hypothetical protein